MELCREHPPHVIELSHTMTKILEVSPIKIKFWSKLYPIHPSDASNGSIVLSEAKKDIGIQVPEEPLQVCHERSILNNPLVSTGLITPDLAGLFYPTDEAIPAGSKRPLRSKSKARVLTAQKVMDDLQV